MSPKVIFHRLGLHVLEEAQLLAERKWIINTLTKIKNQRNCIQIERLHLESLKLRVKSETNASVEVKTQPDDSSNDGSKSAVDLMQNVPKNLGRYEDPGGLNVTDEEIYCNEQALDLMISRIYANSHDIVTNNIEEDEEEEDDIMIDMDMLMNVRFK